MRKTIENEEGYALLVVLFLVVFIFTVSAVFFRGGLSNAKQEQKVDQNHLAVVAAEMGVDYYIGKVNNEERLIQKKVLNEMQDEILKLNICGGRPDQQKPECKIDPIETVLKEAKEEYLNQIATLVNAIKISDPTVVKLYSTDKSRLEGSPYSYQPDKDEVKWQENDGKLVIEMGINGYSKAEKPKLIKLVLSYDVPRFIIRKSGDSNQPNVNPGDIYDFFKNNSDFEEKFPCTDNGHCSSGKYYSTGDLTAKNSNNQGGLLLVHNGTLDMKNMNQFHFNLIVKSLVGKKMNTMNGKLVLLGGEKQSGKIPDPIKGRFERNGRLCINFDGFPKKDIEKIDFDKANQIYFYSSIENPEWPTNANDSHKITSGSLVDFVNECIGQPLIEISSSEVVQYELFESTLDLLVDVSY